MDDPTPTPTPTPDYYIVVTSTAGANMALERTATYGDALTCLSQLAILAVLFVAFAYTYWKGRINA